MDVDENMDVRIGGKQLSKCGWLVDERTDGWLKGVWMSGWMSG